MSEEEVLVEMGVPVAGAATVTLNRPSRGNSLTSGMLERLTTALGRLEQDPRVLVVVLAARGKYFCTGMDLGGGAPAGLAAGGVAENAFARVARFGKPLVARVQGPCLGGGVGLLFACDIRLAVVGSFVQFSEVLRGLVPALISAVIVPQLGLFKSRQYMMTGEKVSAEQLLRDGQLSRVLPDEAALDGAVAEAARAQLQCAPGAAAEVKRVAAYLSSSHSETDKAAYVAALFARMMSSPEAAHGIVAFAAKQSPDWPSFAARSKL